MEIQASQLGKLVKAIRKLPKRDFCFVFYHAPAILSRPRHIEEYPVEDDHEGAYVVAYTLRSFDETNEFRPEVRGIKGSASALFFMPINVIVPCMIAGRPPQSFKQMIGARRNPVAAHERTLAEGGFVVVEEVDNVVFDFGR